MPFKIREIEIEAGSLSAQSRGTNLNQNGTGAAMKVEPPSKLTVDSLDHYQSMYIGILSV